MVSTTATERGDPPFHTYKVHTSATGLYTYSRLTPTLYSRQQHESTYLGTVRVVYGTVSQRSRFKILQGGVYLPTYRQPPVNYGSENLLGSVGSATGSQSRPLTTLKRPTWRSGQVVGRLRGNFRSFRMKLPLTARNEY